MVDIDDSEYCIDVVIQQLWYFVYQEPCLACGSIGESESRCAGRTCAYSTRSQPSMILDFVFRKESG